MQDARPAVHKCVGPAGVVYQDRPCGSDATSRPDDVADASLSVLPAPPRASTIERRAAPARPPRVERVRRAEFPLAGNPAERRHLRVGMSEGEVIARAGMPDLTTGKGRKQSRWTWMPAAGDPDTITVVLFETGRAVEVERTVIKR
ncbi:MAG: hypothetical protein ABI585_02075 [Betaproteobacteria bacterium]